MHINAKRQLSSKFHASSFPRFFVWIKNFDASTIERTGIARLFRVREFIDIYIYIYEGGDDVDSGKQIVAARNDKLTGPAHSYGHWLIAIYLQISRALRAFTPRPRCAPPLHGTSPKFASAAAAATAASTRLVVCHLLRTELTPTAPRRNSPHHLPYFRPRKKERKNGKKRESW